jgi:hypothetical protein
MHAQSMLTIAALTALTACPSSSARPVPPGGSDACAEAAPNIYRAGEGRAEAGSAEEGRVLAAIADTCRGQAWSSELIACMGSLETIKEDRPCGDLMTESQSKYLEDAFEGDEHAPPAVAEMPFAGEWWGTIDTIPGQPHRFELTDTKVNYGRPDTSTGWFIEEPYTFRDGMLLLDRPDAITEAKDACYVGMGVSACEAPEMVCLRVESVTDYWIELSFGMDCEHLDNHFKGKLHE